MSDHDLGQRSLEVIEGFFEGRDTTLDPADRAEAEAFWHWLGGFERPKVISKTTRAEWPRRVAASIIALALIGSGLMAIQLRHLGRADVTQVFSTGHAERRQILLSDSSIVTLAADSRIEVAFAPGERRLQLIAGEALFKVAHNRSRPFIVQTAHGEVRAVGTAFDVSTSRAEADVTVVEGVVRIAVAEGKNGDAAEPFEKLARRGEHLSFGISKGSSSSTSFIRQAADVDPATAIAWTRGLLVFRGEPLREVLVKVNRYAKQKIVLSDPAAGGTPVYGVVNQGDTEAVRELIANPNAVAVDSLE